MRSLLSLSFLFLLSFAAAAPVSSPDADADAIPTPTLSNRASNPRLFTVQAFESPDPSGVGLTAYYLGATKSGTIYLSATAPSPATVLYVDSGTRAYLVGLIFFLDFCPDFREHSLASSAFPSQPLTNF